MAETDTDDLVKAARDAFDLAKSAENHNRQTAIEDINFARRGEQWPADIQRQRQTEGRPCLTINKLPVFIRQVVNDSRQNKPSIKVHPADSNADPETAEVFDGLIRNIEYTSNADVAYDTAIESAVSGGFGYWRIALDYAYDDAFDLDLCIKRVSNQFSVYGDPNSTAADSSDWDVAFIVDRLTKAQFEKQYGDKAQVDWDDDAWQALRGTDWNDGETVLIAEWWTREEVDKPIVLLSDGTILSRDDLEKNEDLQTQLALGLIQIVSERVTKSHKVTQRIMSGLEVLDTQEWPGKYIPIVPVYGDEFDVEGKRYFRSLIHPAIDAQRMFNYWRTASTEMVALAPKVPFLGPKGAFDHDQDRWQTANTRSHPYLEYEGQVAPQRQPLDMGVAAGALQEALNASDDMKAIIGLYDASLGARSNETSGRAIMARQREGDIATFHFIDNLTRAIRHTGRILIDLIPKVYSSARIVRVLGEDGEEQSVPVNQQFPATDPQTGQPAQGPDGLPIMQMHDLAAGKYDLTVKSGPSFTTRREESVASMTEMVRAFPAAAPVIGPELAKNMDWPGADKIAQKLEAISQSQVPPQVQQQMEDGKKQIEQLTQENQQLKMDQSSEMAKIEAQKQLDAAKLNNQREIEIMKIQSDETIAQMKIASEAKIAAIKADYAAQNAAEASRLRATQPAQPSR